MGYYKNEQIRKQEAFSKLAETNKWICANCGNTLTREELGTERNGQDVCFDCMHAIDRMIAE